MDMILAVPNQSIEGKIRMMAGFSHILPGPYIQSTVMQCRQEPTEKRPGSYFCKKSKGTRLAVHSLPAMVRWLSLQTKHTHRQPEQPEHSSHVTHEVAPGHAQPKLTNHFASFLVFAKKKSLLV